MSSEGGSQKTERHKLITEVHVEAALKADKGNEAELVSWSIHDFAKKGDNFAAVVTSVRISYRLGGKSLDTSYIVKINPGQENEDYRKLVDAQFVKEGGFYERILPELNSELRAIGQEPLRCPRWIHGSFGNGKDLIFLEDLRPRGFRMQEARKGLDVNQASLVLQELARFHAASILLRDNCLEEDLALKYRFLTVDFHNYSERAEVQCGNVFSENFRDVSRILQKTDGYEIVQKWLTDNRNKTMDIFRRQLVASAPYDVICHGDCWINNLLFRYDERGVPLEVMLLDLQLTRRTSLATDLNYFMYTSFTGDVRKGNLDDFLATYYNAFSQVMKGSGKPMPFIPQELLQEYRNKHEFGLLFGMFSTMLILRPSDEVPDFIEMYDEQDFVKESGISEKSLSLMDKDPLFWPRLLSIFDDMIEHGVIA